VVAFVSRCRLLDWCAVLSGGVCLKVLLFCCNRMGMFLVSGFIMTVMWVFLWVCDSIRLIVM
jgi:hypothetical protein